MSYKLLPATRGEYIQGYAARVRVEEGRIVLEDRRVPIIQFREGLPTTVAIRLGDLELSTAPDHGWAVWAAVERVSWWDKSLAA